MELENFHRYVEVIAEPFFSILKSVTMIFFKLIVAGIS